MMMDPRKLQQARSAADEQIVALHLERGVPLTWTRTLLANAVGFDLYCERLSHWWFATAVSYQEQDTLHIAAIEQSPRYAAAAELAIRATRHAQAASREMAELGVICRLLDPTADVQLDAEDQAAFYPPGVIWDPADVWQPYVEVFWEGEMDRYWSELDAASRTGKGKGGGKGAGSGEKSRGVKQAAGDKQADPGVTGDSTVGKDKIRSRANP